MAMGMWVSKYVRRSMDSSWNFVRSGVLRPKSHSDPKEKTHALKLDRHREKTKLNYI